MKNSIITGLIAHRGIFNTKLFLLFVIGLTLLLFSSCRKVTKTRCNDCLILHASLDEENIPLNKLFKKIELIPLETTDNSLIQYPYKYNYLNGKHYILDTGLAILFIFDQEGKYLNRIAKRGQGPGEYNLIYDFSLNKEKGQIEMLSPYRFINCYDFNGNFIKKYDLTFLFSPNIQRMDIIDDKNYVFWSDAEDEHDCISIISQETGELVNSFWQDIFIINSWSGDVFYKYNNEIYFSLFLYNTVYKVTKDGFSAAYEWNFGNNTMDISQHNISTGMYNYNSDKEIMIAKMENNKNLYEFICHFQNRQYYYAQLRFERKMWKHIFYNKQSGESCFFEYPAEGIKYYFKYDE